MDKKTIVRKRTEISDIRDPYFCVWLQEMAEKGLLFKGQDIFTCRFEVTTPHRRKYRIVERSYRKISKEERAQYNDAGWYAVASRNGATIYTTDSMDEPELFDNNDNRVRLVKGRMLYSTIMVILGIVVIVSSLGNIRSQFFNEEMINDIGRLHTLESALMPREIAVISILGGLILFVGMIILIINEIRLIKLYSGIDSYSYVISYSDSGYLKAKRRTKKLLRLLFVCGVALPLITFCSKPLFGDVHKEGKRALVYSNDYPVMYREIDPDSWNSIAKVIEGGDEHGEMKSDYSVEKGKAD